jgi:hypothetical protein
MSLYTNLHNLLQVLVQIANKTGLQKKIALFTQYTKTKLHGLSPRANYTDRATSQYTARRINN